MNDTLRQIEKNTAETARQIEGDGFRPGQTVMLKSGGPGMTVIDVGLHSGVVLCRLMKEDGIAEFSFPQVTLSVDPRAHCHQP